MGGHIFLIPYSQNIPFNLHVRISVGVNGFIELVIDM